MTEALPRLTRVRFAGLRTAASVELDLTGLTVLIGPNGVGKSTLIEGMELLRKLATGEDFVRVVHDEHGGPASLLAHGASELKLGVDVEHEGNELRYGMVLEHSNGSFSIVHESIQVNRATRIIRTEKDLSTDGRPTAFRRPRQSILSVPLGDDLDAVASALIGIDVHTPFMTQPAWLGRGASFERSTRSDNIIQATPRLARGGSNLPNAFHTLRNRDDWQDTLATIRVVVDEDIRDIVTPAHASGGTIGLAVVYRAGTVPSFALSDGTLALLSLVVIASLDEETFPRSLLVLDEPDLHLHPTAIRYVVALLERCAKKYPVVIATHSDQLLDCLSDPARSTVLCELDEHRHLRLQRPDAAQLAKWLPKYRGVGQLRAEGYGSLVFPPAPSVASKS